MDRARPRVRKLVRARARTAAAPIARRPGAALSAALLVALLAGCSKHETPAPNVGYGLALQAAGGVYDDGSGAPGLAVLSTLRDASGAGPSAPWTVTLRDGAGDVPLTLTFDGGAAAGSYQAVWSPAVAPRPGAYAATAASAAQSLEVDFSVAAATLARPVVSVSSDAGSLSWPALPWAASYQCRAYDGGASAALVTSSVAPSCDLSALPSGAYQVSVLALSADLTALAASGAQMPSLPARFDVAETRLALVRPTAGAPALKVAAAGGALQYGSAAPGLAIWLSITQPDGTPTQAAWSVSVSGPGLPADAPLAFGYAAGEARTLVWSYDVPATPGTYALTASSSLGNVATTFTVGNPAQLAIPQDVVATGDARGGATVDFGAVSGARSYFVGVWTQATATAASTFIDGQWISGPPAKFPSGSFASGAAYDVYVAATDADLVNAGPPPAQVAVSEDTFFPATFVAP